MIEFSTTSTADRGKQVEEKQGLHETSESYLSFGAARVIGYLRCVVA
jgi:hypothetical protein